MGADARGAPDTVEVEWQFDALDLRPVERWLAGLPARAADLPSLPVLTVRTKPPRRLVDRYVDTADWRLGRAGMVLRTRTRGQQEEATLKDTAPATAGGLRRRLEVTEPLPASGLDGLGDGGPVGRRVAALVGTRPLRPVLEVRTRRQPFSVRSGADEVAEVALDQTVLVMANGEPPAHLLRVEVEVDPDWAGTLEPLVDELRAYAGLRPATRSKYEAGLLAAGLAVPGPPDLGPTAVGRDATLAELAFAMLRRSLAMLLAHEPGARLGEDPEELHDLRVATRRLRAVLDVFADAFPAAAALRQELAWMAGVLGAVRDLDVQLVRLEQLAPPSVTGGAPSGEERRDGRAGIGGGGGGGGALDASAIDEVRRVLEAQRHAARRRLLEALDTDRWERAKATLVRLATGGASVGRTAARLPAALVVGQLVGERHRQAVDAAARARRSGAPADFHRLRIRCKRLRYSLELTTPLYGALARRYTRKLATLQETLGLLQDDEVARAQLRAIATEPSDDHPPLSPTTVFALGEVAEAYRRDAEQRARAMRRRLGKLTGRAWKDLAARMEQRRQAAEAGLPSAPLGLLPQPAEHRAGTTAADPGTHAG